MRWGAACIAGLAATFGAAALAVAAPVPGDPPTVDTKRCYRGIRPCTEPLVLASGTTFASRVEIIGFSSSEGFCLEKDALRGKRFTGITRCGGHAAPSGGKPVGISVFSVARFTGGSTTELLGVTGPEVAGVRLRYRHHGETAYEQPIFGHVEGDLASRVSETTEFGVYAVTVHGCIPSNRMRMVAFDSAGSILGHTSFPDVGDLCDSHDSGSSQTTVIPPGGGPTRFLHAER